MKIISQTFIFYLIKSMRTLKFNILIFCTIVPSVFSFKSDSHSQSNITELPSPMSFFDDYSEKIHCNSHDFGDDERLIEIQLDSINLRWIDSIVFLTLGTITFCSTSFIILTFVKYKQTREPPGDIILGISIAEFVLTIHWMVSAGRFLSYPNEPPKSGSTFCFANSIISMTAGTYEFLYNCCFCLFVIYKVRSVLKGSAIRRDIFHILCLIITLCLMLGLGYQNSLGKNLFGTCSVKAVSKFPLIGPILFVIYVVLAFATIYYFKKTVPNDERFRQYREDFLNYYYKYVKACSIIWSVLAFCNIVAVANCFTNDGGVAGLNIFLTLGNCSKLFTPLVLSFLRYQDPFIKKRVNRFCRKLKNWILRKPLNTTLVMAGEKFLPEEEKNGEMENPGDKAADQQVECVINQPLEDNRNAFDSGSIIDDSDIWLNMMKNDMKVMFTYTMISGILLNYKNVRGALEMSKTPEHQNFEKTNRYPINNDTLRLYLPEVMKFLESKNFNALPTHMTVYAPEVFEELIEHDGDMIDLDASLDLEKNYEQIQKASGADGGKGGEFFFFSHDNRIILKTLSNQDLDQLRGILKEYYRYFEKNKDSLIAKIYGIYTFERKDVKDQKFSILLMRNIAAVPRKYVLRTYDLKGSTFDREVLKNKPDAELNKATLKDLDFLKLERKIFIEDKLRKRLHNILQKDSEFFKNHELIDYSLIVFKIDKRRYFDDLESEGMNSADFFLNKRELYSLKSVAEEGYFYHIGVIDYLQPYNLQKYFEKNLKKIIKVDKDLNTSSQDPKTYQTRFEKFINEII